MSRSSVVNPLLSGFILLDTVAPIGKGQRQLIVGDRGSGKTTLGVNVIKNQKRGNRFFSPEGFGGHRVFCIFVGVGMRRQKLKQISTDLIASGGRWYSILVDATAATSFALQFIAPFSATSLGEVFRDNSCNSLLVYDDLKAQANAYRELGLLTRKPPGREAYPGDTFFLHSRLLERSSQLSARFGYGSLTSLPICDTFNNNISAYIVTNLISITDGQ